MGVIVSLLGGGGREAVREARAGGAEVICMPQLSFLPYLPAVPDRAGLEHAERPVARSYRDALEAADGAWLAASAYESEGEGVFYATAMLGRGDVLLRHRQRRLDAEPGRYEPLLFSPGHEPPRVVDLPWGPTGVLIGADLRDPRDWADLAAAGARVVLGGASEPADLWERTARVVSGQAALHGITAAVANRDGTGAVWDGGGARVAPRDDGRFEVAA